MALCGQLGWYYHIVGLHLVAHDSVEELLAMAIDRPPSRGRALACFTSGMVAASTGNLTHAIDAWTRMAEDGRATGEVLLESFGCTGAGYCWLGLGNLDRAGPLLDEGIALGERGRSEFLQAIGLTIKGMLVFLTGDAAGGRAMVEAARRIQVRLGDYETGGMALSFLASMTFAAGDLPAALRLYREAEAAFETVGDKPEVARVQCEMGYAALAGDDIGEARRMFQRALRTHDEVGSPRGTGQALVGLAAAEAAAGHTQRAVTIAAAAKVLSEKAGVLVSHPLATGVAERIEAIQAAIPSGELDALVSSGSGLTPAAVLAMVAD